MAKAYVRNTKRGAARAARRAGTAQTKAIPGREADMVRNDAGGVVFALDGRKRLERFLILGASSTYYASEAKSARRSLADVEAEIERDPAGAVALAVEVSTSGRAASNDHAIMVLAMALASESQEAKDAAKSAVPKVCRTATHLFTLVHYVDGMRSWGRSVRRAVASWYENQTGDGLELQLVKYQGRTVEEGSNNKWTHRDVMRLAHPRPKCAAHEKLFAYAAGKEVEGLGLVDAVRELQAGGMTEAAMARHIAKHRIPHEAWTPEAIASKAVWEAQLDGMGMTALVRNLARLTANGVLSQHSPNVDTVVARLTDEGQLRAARIHPYQVLLAFKTYELGRGIRGGLSWTPVHRVLDALDEAFRLSFGAIEPSGASTLLALDVSRSMSSPVNGRSNGLANSPISCREASGVMAMVTARKEKRWDVMGFHGGFQPIDITPRMDIGQVTREIYKADFGVTDCSLPMLWALKNKREYDVFVVYTDNETYAGAMQPSQALEKYRRELNPKARLVVVGLAGQPFTIADPADWGSMDVVGFDAAAPGFIADFSAGRL